MSLDSFSVVRPNQKNQTTNPTGNPLELAIEEFTGDVEGTIARMSVTENFVKARSVRGTTSITNRSVGEAKLGVVVPGQTPDGTPVDFSKIVLTVDRTIYARNYIPLLDNFQLDHDARSEMAQEHGKIISKFKDQAYLIQGVKASVLANSPYGSAGHFGGSKLELATAGDENDPAKLYASFCNLFTQIEEKDVDPVAEGLAIFVRPDVFYTMLQAEQVINGQYVTSDGTKVEGHIFKAWGVPVMKTNNLPNTDIKAATAGSIAAMMGSAYEVDATKLVACVMSPRAILAGTTIELESDVFYDKMSKTWVVDSHLAFNATPNRPEFAGSIWKK